VLDPDAAIALLETVSLEEDARPFPVKRTLLEANVQGRHNKKVFDLAKKMFQSQPKSQYLFDNLGESAVKMYRSGDPEGADALAEAKQLFTARDPSFDNPFLTIFLTEIDSVFPGIVAALDSLASEGRADAPFYNHVAWSALFKTPLHPKALQ